MLANTPLAHANVLAVDAMPWQSGEHKRKFDEDQAKWEQALGIKRHHSELQSEDTEHGVVADASEDAQPNKRFRSEHDGREHDPSSDLNDPTASSVANAPPLYLGNGTTGTPSNQPLNTPQQGKSFAAADQVKVAYAETRTELSETRKYFTNQQVECSILTAKHCTEQKLQETASKRKPNATNKRKRVSKVSAGGKSVANFESSQTSDLKGASSSVVARREAEQNAIIIQEAIPIVPSSQEDTLSPNLRQYHKSSAEQDIAHLYELAQRRARGVVYGFNPQANLPSNCKPSDAQPLTQDQQSALPEINSTVSQQQQVTQAQNQRKDVIEMANNTALQQRVAQDQVDAVAMKPMSASEHAVQQGYPPPDQSLVRSNRTYASFAINRRRVLPPSPPYSPGTGFIASVQPPGTNSQNAQSGRQTQPQHWHPRPWTIFPITRYSRSSCPQGVLDQRRRLPAKTVEAQDIYDSLASTREAFRVVNQVNPPPTDPFGSYLSQWRQIQLFHEQIWERKGFMPTELPRLGYWLFDLHRWTVVTFENRIRLR